MPKSETSSASDKTAANIHDDFFRDVFETPENLIALLRAGCPQALLDIIERSTLHPEPARIAADRLQTRTADLVYSAKLSGSGSSARVVLLLEHKSFHSRELERQLARSQFLWHLQDDFKSLIIPVAVRQNAADSRASIRFRDLFGTVSKPHLEALMGYALDFRRLLQLVIGYICRYNRDIEPQDVLSLETATEEDRKRVISAADAFRVEGRVEGLEKVALNLLQAGMESQRVAALTELSREQVKSLRSKMNSAGGQSDG